MLAALYVDPCGVYSTIQGVECWGPERDARNYAGPHPVIAHPPCQLWGNFAPINYKRWGGEHNRPGNDGGCFRAALDAVNVYGGVLEHPARTKAWTAHDLTAPLAGCWVRSGGGWVCEVWQSAYGHLAAKATWLYYVGTDRPPDLDWSRRPGTHQIGNNLRMRRRKPTLRGKAASATPPDFARVLISLAQNSSPKPS